MQENQKKNEETVEENGEKVKPFVEEADFNKPDYTFIPKGNHLWHQEAYYLVCESCDLKHATFIGKDRIMVGQDEENNPIIKKRSEVGMA